MKNTIFIAFAILVSSVLYSQRKTLVAGLGTQMIFITDSDRLQYITGRFETMVKSNFSSSINLGYLIPISTYEKTTNLSVVEERNSKIRSLFLDVSPMTYNFKNQLKGFFIGINGGIYRFAYESSEVTTLLPNNTIINSIRSSNVNNTYLAGLHLGWRAWLTSKIGFYLSGGILLNDDKPLYPLNLKLIYNLKNI